MTKAAPVTEGAFRDEVIVITGGASGLGLAYGEAFAQHEAQVVIGDIDSRSAAESAAEITRLRGRALGLPLDVSSESSVREFFSAVRGRFGRLDVLVNNAAIVPSGANAFKPFWETTWDEWQRMMAVNSGGVFLCCREARGLMAKGGRIINVTSDGIWSGPLGQMAYLASKGAVAVMTRCLARELGFDGIRVNSIAPGLTWSASATATPALRESRTAIVEARALRREQYPADLVGTILFLSGPGSDCITGQTVVVNSGGVMP